LELGKNNLQEVRPPKSNDIYGIFHSSGTCGSPKGALISHRALLATATGPTIQWFGENQKLNLTSADKYMSFLSPAHVYEQIMEVGIG
jgi:long-subunit acyl-CoA synthetase (AMP-forming)